MTPTKLLIFGAATVGLVLFSWTSLRDPRSHGFYRFFAFEFLILLVLTNVDFWFSNPLSPRQIASWLFLASSIFLAIHGFYLLSILGKSEGRIEGSANFGFENSTQLIKAGAYKYIRHPLYCSLLLVACGAFLKDVSLIAGSLFVLVAVSVFLMARMDEEETLKRFGAEYESYMKETWMFVPFLL